MRNSSLVEWVCAENITGLKPNTEAAGFSYTGAVGERCRSLRRRTVRSAGGPTSAYADMSNDKQGEKPCRRKPKVSWVKLIFPGLVDP
jgi:hypothetical protein